MKISPMDIQRQEFAQQWRGYDREATWRQIEALRKEHLALLEEIEERFHDFSDLDSRFHRLVNSVVPNRFIDGFQGYVVAKKSR